MITTSPVGSDFTSQVVLSTGEIAGEGSGPSVESANFWAVYSAIKSGNARYVTAGRGHAVYLNAADQARIAALK